MYTNTELRRRVIAIFNSDASVGRERLALALVDKEGATVDAAIGILRASAKEQPAAHTPNVASIYETRAVESSSQVYARMAEERQAAIRSGNTDAIYAARSGDAGADEIYRRMAAQREALIARG